MESKRTDLGTK